MFTKINSSDAEFNKALQKALERVNSDEYYAKEACECNKWVADRVEEYLKNGGSKALFYKFYDDLLTKTPRYAFIKNIDGHDITIDLYERLLF